MPLFPSGLSFGVFEASELQFLLSLDELHTSVLKFIKERDAPLYPWTLSAVPYLLISALRNISHSGREFAFEFRGKD